MQDKEQLLKLFYAEVGKHIVHGALDRELSEQVFESIDEHNLFLLLRVAKEDELPDDCLPSEVGELTCEIMVSENLIVDLIENHGVCQAIEYIIATVGARLRDDIWEILQYGDTESDDGYLNQINGVRKLGGWGKVKTSISKTIGVERIHHRDNFGLRLYMWVAIRQAEERGARDVSETSKR